MCNALIKNLKNFLSGNSIIRSIRILILKEGIFMLNVQDPHRQLVLEEIGQYVQNPVFMQFCLEIKKRYHCTEKIEYSSCKPGKGLECEVQKSGEGPLHPLPSGAVFPCDGSWWGEGEKRPWKPSCRNLHRNCRGFTARQTHGIGKDG